LAFWLLLIGMGFVWVDDFKKEVAAMSGTSYGGGARVAARVQF
jgi:hypothetical protein